MRPASADFFRTIRESHEIVSYVTATSPTGQVVRLEATDGNVSIDRTADIRRRCTITCVDSTGEFSPRSATDLLTPTGTEITVYRGVKYPSGIEEVVSVGVFRLSKVTITDTTSLVGTPGISLEGYDRSRTVSRDKFTEPYTVAQGSNVIQAIKDILARTFDNLSYDSVSTTLTTTAPMVFDTSDDPWGAVTNLAAGVGCEIFFDATGNVVIAPPVDVDHLPAPDWDFTEGVGCQMLGLNVVYTDEPGYNGVVLTGESTADELPPVRSVIWDEEPTSPTYHLGPYGEVPMFVTNNIVTTQADADSVATATLNATIGITSQLSVSALVNPALEANDTVTVTRAKSGIAGKYAIDSITVPMMASETAEITLRAKRVTS